MLVGTSTGAITAMALKIGYSAAEVIGLYERNAEMIFQREPFWNQVFHRYSSRNLREVLARFIHERTNKLLTWEQLCDGSEFQDGVELLVTLWNVSQGKTSFLSTNSNRRGQEEALFKASLADIITACCAGPYFFPPRAFGVPDGPAQVYCDGGITGLNNPAVFGTSLAVAEMLATTPETSIQVLSFGSGLVTQSISTDTLQTWTALEAALNTIDALMISSAALMDEFYRILGSPLGIAKYFRTNQPRQPTSELDDIANMVELKNNFCFQKISYRLFTRHEDGKLSVDEGHLTSDRLHLICADEFGLGRGPSVEASPETDLKTSGNLGPVGSEMRRLAGWSRVHDRIRRALAGLRRVSRWAVAALSVAASSLVFATRSAFAVIAALHAAGRQAWKQNPAPTVGEYLPSWEVRASWSTNPQLATRAWVSAAGLLTLIGAVFIFNHLRSRATQARDEATAAQSREQIAKRVAIAQRDVAKMAELEASNQRAIANNLREQQAIIANCEVWANRSQLIAANLPGQLLNSAVMLSAQANNRLLAFGIRSLGADQSLRATLALAPRKLKSINLGAEVFSRGLFFSEDDKRLLIFGNDGKVRAWNFLTNEMTVLFEMGGPLALVSFSRSSSLCAAVRFDERKGRFASKETSVLLYKLPDGAHRSLPHPSPVEDVALSEDGALVATFCKDGVLRLWDVLQNKIRASISHKENRGEENVRALHSWFFHHLHFGPKNAFLAFAVDHFFPDSGNSLEEKSVDTVFIVGLPDMKETGRLAMRDIVRAVRVSRDGTYVAAASRGRMAKILDLKKGVQSELVHGGDTGDIASIAFSPSGRLLATCSHDYNAWLWDVRTGALISNMRHDANVSEIEFTPDDRYFVTISDDATARIWNTSTGREVSRMVHGARVTSESVDKDGFLLATEAWDRTVRLWETPITPKFVTTQFEDQHANGSFVDTPDAPTAGVVFSIRGRTCYILTEDDTVTPWGITASSDILFCAYHQATQTVALVCDSHIFFWRIDLHRRKASFINESQQLSARPQTGDFSVNGETITMVEREERTRRSHVEVFTVKDGVRVDLPDDSHAEFLMPRASVDYVGLARAQYEETKPRNEVELFSDRKLKRADLTLISTVTGKEVAKVSSTHWFHAYDFSSSGLFAYAADDVVTLLDLTKGGTVKQTYHVPAFVHRIEYRHNDRLVITESHDGKNYYYIYDGIRADPIRAFVRSRHNHVLGNGIEYDEPNYFSINHERELIAVNDGAGPSRSGIVNVFSLVTNERLGSFPHSERITRAAISPDGKYLVTAGWDAVVYVWDINTGREIVSLKPAIRSGWTDVDVQFSRNTRYILTSSGSALGSLQRRTLGVWLFQPEDLIAAACRRIDRNLDPGQWHNLFGEEPFCKLCPSLP
jgi:WD40 repeat protein